MNTKHEAVDTTALNDQIVQLWSEYFDDSKDVYAPYFYKPLTKGSLAYVGVNPSFSIPAIERITQGTEYEGIDVEKFFNWQEVKNDTSRIADLVRFEEYASQKYSSYFKPMHKFAKDTNLPPQALETFCIVAPHKKNSPNSYLRRVNSILLERHNSKFSLKY